MKILVLQLARLGDIYQTWPTLKALKRSGAEIHLLTRAKFASAAPGTDVVDRHWLLDTRDMLLPLVDEKPGVDLSLEKLGSFCDQLRAENFDRVINLSFSPFSSYLTREVATPDCEVRGYSRFEDGYLAIPDDGSAYFYGQVGVDKPNRLHVTDLFAFVAGVELTEDDWRTSVKMENARLPKEAGEHVVAIHVGASALGKTLSTHKWQQVAKGLCESPWVGSVVLIGAPDEAGIAEQIAAISSVRKPVSLVGQTSLDELFELVGEASLLIGGDSGPMQIASLLGTPVLNISLPLVSFWETGPRSKGSRIIVANDESDVAASEIAAEALTMLAGQPPKLPVVRVLGPLVPYLESRPQPLAFEWDLLLALYMGHAFPQPPSELFLLAMRRLADVNQLALEQIEALRRVPGNKTAAAILDRSDEIMDQILGMVPEAAPIVRWFRVERTRIGPMEMKKLVEATDSVHRRLADVIGIYVDTGGSSHDDVDLG